MFYRKEDVDEAIICGICNEIYKDPRFLPCSESACHECIQSTIQSDTNKEFNCIFCNEKHTPSVKDGFPLISALTRLLKAKADNVYRNAKVDELKEKLIDIKSKCDEFKSSLDNGVDQVREHCTRLRNQVHLETEVIIEEAHKFNESLIAEIDKYEKECIDSFNSNMKRNELVVELVVELNDFYSDKTKYLAEFKIDNKVVEESIAKADGHLRKLKIENGLLEKLQFNGEIAEFKKRPNKIDRTLLGTIVYKSLNSYEYSLNEVKFTNNSITSYLSSIHLFKNHDGNNFAFYMDTNRHLNMTKFDNIGNVVKKVNNPLNCGHVGSYSQISQLKVVQSLDYFIFYVELPGYSFGNIYGRQLSNLNGIKGLFFILDHNFKYIKHKSDSRDAELIHIATNNSRIIWVDSNYKYYYFDMNFASLSDKPLDAITTQVGNTIVDVQMNDKFVLFLCNDKKLKIFEIKSGDLVKEIDTNADQIKLTPVNHIVLFDSVNRIIVLYKQIDEFSKLDEVDLAQSLEADLKINHDQSNCLAFYNSTYMKCCSLN